MHLDLRYGLRLRSSPRRVHEEHRCHCQSCKGREDWRDFEGGETYPKPSAAIKKGLGDSGNYGCIDSKSWDRGGGAFQAMMLAQLRNRREIVILRHTGEGPEATAWGVGKSLQGKIKWSSASPWATGLRVLLRLSWQRVKFRPLNRTYKASNIDIDTAKETCT